MPVMGQVVRRTTQCTLTSITFRRSLTLRRPSRSQHAASSACSAQDMPQDPPNPPARHPRRPQLPHADARPRRRRRASGAREPMSRPAGHGAAAPGAGAGAGKRGPCSGPGACTRSTARPCVGAPTPLFGGWMPGYPWRASGAGVIFALNTLASRVTLAVRADARDVKFCLSSPHFMPCISALPARVVS